MKIRKSAVSGQFYPALPDALRKEVENYLMPENAGASPCGYADMLIAPHAGYIFSAPVAAKAYARISPNVDTVILIGPSHRKMFDGIHLTDAGYYETPLGLVEINQKIAGELRAHPLCQNVFGADEEEHCLEVHLPFLQVLLREFTIVPLYTGVLHIGAAADMLLPYINGTTIIIASSDLSHFLPHSEARKTDAATIASILSGDTGGFMDSCGETAMRIVMDMAAKRGLSAELLDARTSYETAPEYGADRVVGYASFVFNNTDSRNAPLHGISDNTADNFTDDEKKYLLDLARATLTSSVNNTDTPAFQTENHKLLQSYGCFVTLNSNGRLRGCIGNIEPVKSLHDAVIDNTVNAAFYDPRFQKVSAPELDDITISISVLTKPQPLEFDSPEDLLSKLIPFEHGVILKLGPYQSTFLPQVWEQLPDKISFLEYLAMKAGMGKDDWKKADVWVYRAVCFGEGEET